MKLKNAKLGANAASTKVVVTTTNIAFTTDHKGTYTALVPMRYPNSGEAGDNRQFIASVPLKVSSETSRNQKGRVRTMLKVILPYRAVMANASDADPNVCEFDANRSSGDIECHIVLSTPRGCREDFNGNHGRTCQRVAAAQIAAALRLLGACCGDVLCGGNSSTVVFDSNQGKIVASQFNMPATFRSELANGGDLDPENLDGHLVPTPVVGKFDITDIPGYSVPGIDATALTGLVNHLDSPFVRGLNALEPLAEEGDIQSGISLNVKQHVAV